MCSLIIHITVESHAFPQRISVNFIVGIFKLKVLREKVFFISHFIENVTLFDILETTFIKGINPGSFFQFHQIKYIQRYQSLILIGNYILLLSQDCVK